MDADDLARCKANHPAYWWARRREQEDGDDAHTERVHPEAPCESA